LAFKDLKAGLPNNRQCLGRDRGTSYVRAKVAWTGTKFHIVKNPTAHSARLLEGGSGKTGGMGGRWWGTMTAMGCQRGVGAQQIGLGGPGGTTCFPFTAKSKKKTWLGPIIKKKPLPWGVWKEGQGGEFTLQKGPMKKTKE